MGGTGNGTFTVPYAFVTPTNRGGQLLIVAISAITVTILSVILRIYVSSRDSRGVKREPQRTLSLYKDDLLCFVAALFCIIEFALVWTGLAQGNGKAIDLISPQHLDHVQRNQYAIDIIYIIILYCSRASVIFLLERLQGLGFRPLWTYSIAILSLWFIASIFAVALKCDLSHPWIQYNVQCTGLLSRWLAIEILGIVTECAIFGLALHLVYIGRMGVASRLKILVLFSTRILVLVFAALRISYLSEYFHSTDPTYSGIPAAIYAFAEANASVITATTPLLKSFTLKFTFIQSKTTVIKPLVVFSVAGRHDPSKTAGSRRGSNLSEHEKPTAASSSGGEPRPGSGDNPLSV